MSSNVRAGSLLHRWRRVRVEDNYAADCLSRRTFRYDASAIQKFSKSRSSTRRVRTRVGLPQRRGRRGSIVAVGETAAGSLLHRWRRVRVEDNCAAIFCFAAHSDATSAASRNSANQGPPPAACGHASASPNDGGGEDRSSPLARLLLVPSSTVGGGLGWRTTVRRIVCRAAHPEPREPHPAIQKNQGPPPAACGHASAPTTGEARIDRRHWRDNCWFPPPPLEEG